VKIHDDEAAQAAVEEEQVHAIPLVVDAQPPLTADEGQVAAEFQQEGFQMPDERVLQFRLGVFVAQIEELQHQRIADRFVGGERVAGRGFRAFLEHRGLVL
jgi:hypothetical protein